MRRRRRRLRLTTRPTRAKPCAASSPAPSDGAPQPTSWSSGWEIRDANLRGRSTTSGPRRSSCWPPRAGVDLRAEKGVQARVTLTSLCTPATKVALAVPTTYMNESGLAVRGLAKRYGIDDPTSIVVVHDELDLPPGTVRVKAGGGLAGHNGLRSLQAHLHSTDFVRVRIGVGKPPSAAQGAAHVLNRPPGPSARSSSRRWRWRRRRSSTLSATVSTRPCNGAIPCLREPTGVLTGPDGLSGRAGSVDRVTGRPPERAHRASVLR